MRGGRDLGSALAGRARPAGGELVVGGLLVPEQREAVNQVATMVDLAAAPPADVEQVVAARARLASFSPRRRRTHAAEVHGLVDELTGVVGRDVLRSAVVDAAMALADGAQVIVLVGVDELPAAEVSATEALAEKLARHGLAVLVVGNTGSPPQGEPGPVLVESGAGAGHE